MSTGSRKLGCLAWKTYIQYHFDQNAANIHDRKESLDSDDQQFHQLIKILYCIPFCIRH